SAAAGRAGLRPARGPPRRRGSGPRSRGKETSFMPEPEGEDEDADQHRHRILVDEPGLHQAYHAGEPAHHARRAVHHEAVDHGLVAAAPEPLADAPRTADEQPRVQLVEA